MAVMAMPRCPAAKYFPSGENRHVDQIQTRVTDLVRVENPDQTLEQ